jgi:tetratricopeptide (TPR) repeat protein
MHKRKKMNRDEYIANPVLQEDAPSHCKVSAHGYEDNAEEKRLHKRLSVKNVNIQSEMSLAKKLIIINISSGGVLVKADRRLNIGNTYILKIGYKDNVLFARAVVKWSFLVESIEDTDGNIVPLYMAGMQFDEVSSEKGEEIVHSIMADVESDVFQLIDHTETSSIYAHSHHDRDLETHMVKEASEIPHDTPPEEIIGETSMDSPGIIIKKIENMYMRYTDKNLSYYELLNVKDNAHADEIKKAYYRRVKEFHPDKHCCLPPKTKEKLNVLFAYLNEAYDTLMSAAQKEHYDRTLLLKQSGRISKQESAHQYFEQGKIEFWNGNFPEAEVLFQHALYICNSSAKYFFYYAKTLLNLGKCREAEKAIKNALKIDSSNSDYLTEAGYIYHALGLSNRAEENFETALGIQPSHAKALKGIIGIRGKRGSGNFDDTLFNPIKALRKIITR